LGIYYKQGGLYPILTWQPDVNIAVEAPVSVTPGESFTVSLDINTVNNFNVADYTVSFNPAVLSLSDITSGTINGTVIPVVYNQISEGTVKVVNDLNQPATGVTGSGSLAVLHFQVVGGVGQTSPIGLSSGTLASNTATEIPASWTGGSVTIVPIPVTINLNGLTQTYDGTPKAVTVTTIPAEVPVNITYNGATTVPTNAGSYAVIVTVSDARYSGSATGTLVIQKADQTISFGVISDKGYASPDFTVSATASSGLAVTFTASGVCSLLEDGITVHITGVGEGSITAHQGGNENYNAAPDVTQTFQVLKTAGDANGDGAINAQDITKTIRIVLGLDTVTETADANGDGLINALDIALIEWTILNAL
jgi:hypothetical protein